MHHAVHSQFPHPLRLVTDPIEDLLSLESLSKPLFSLYLTLLSEESHKMDKLWKKWRADTPTLDKDDWEDCFEESSRLVISSRDKLIQTKLLHRLYYTPQRLQRIYPRQSASCPLCQTTFVMYFHMFWSCARVSQFWTEFFDSCLPCSLQLSCRYWVFTMSSKYAKLLISFLMHYTKKEIICKLTAPSPPSVTLWETSINAVLPMYKLVHINRQCPKKYNKIWQPWMAQ